MLPRRLKLAYITIPGARRTLRWSAAWDRIVRPRPLPADPYMSRQDSAVAMEQGRLFDQSRDLGVSYTVHRPAELSGLHPVVIYSTPMDWGVRRPTPTAFYLAEHMARAGYIAINIGKSDSDRFVVPHDVDTIADQQAYMRQVAFSDHTHHERFRDLSFVIDMIERWNETGPLAGHVDCARIGMCGHSFGGHTTLALIGQRIGAGRRSYRDPRIKAAIIYSVSPAASPNAPDGIYADIRLPVCHMSGTDDYSWGIVTLPEDRLWPYHKTTAPDQYAVVLKGADHRSFDGGRDARGTANGRERLNLQLIRSISLAFWDAHLRGDPAARRWLRSELPRVMRGKGRSMFR